jgi:hypothetical protein
MELRLIVHPADLMSGVWRCVQRPVWARWADVEARIWAEATTRGDATKRAEATTAAKSDGAPDRDMAPDGAHLKG